MTFLGIIALIPIAFCLNDLTTAVNDPTGYPLFTMLITHWGTNKAVAFLLILTTTSAIGGSSQLLSTASQLAAFSRDGGLPSVFARIHAGTNTPLPAIVLLTSGTCLILLFGLSIQASTIIYSLAVIALYITYLVPVITRLTAGTRFVPGPFSLGKFSLPVHAWVLVSSTYMLIILAFPTSRAFDAATFNYNWVVAVGIAIFCGLAWLIRGCKAYQGPDLDIIQARTRSC